MRPRTTHEIEEGKREAERQRIWARRHETKWHPELGIVCPWCKADFCEIDGHDCSRPARGN